MNDKLISYVRKIQPSRKSYVKFELSISGVFHSTLGLFDLGADCSILRSDTVFDMFKHEKPLLMSKLKRVPVSVTGFSGSSSRVLGQITFDLRFSSEGDSLPVKFYIVDKHLKNSACGILGYSSMTYMGLEISKYQVGNRVIPDICRRHSGKLEIIDHYYLTEAEIHGIQSRIQLPTNRIQQYNLKLSDYTTYMENDIVLVTSTYTVNNVAVIPTASCVFKEENSLFVLATILNHSQVDFDENIDFSLENLEDFEIIDINKYNYEQLSRHKVLHEVQILDDYSKFTQPHTLYLNQDQLQESLEIVTETHTIFLMNVEPYITEPPKLSVQTVTVPTFPEIDKGYDPNSENNECEGFQSLSEDRAGIKCSSEYRDFPPDDTIELGMRDPDPEKLANDESIGYSLPEKGYETIGPAEILKLENYKAEIQPYLKKIFLEDNPKVISLHSYDLGHLSDYLGFYKLKLKPHVQLPSHQKLYYLSSDETQHLKDILRFLEGNGIISRAPNEGMPIKFACSSYLVPKRSGQDHSRLIINAIPINRLCVTETPVIPNTQTILNNLSNKHFFTTVDFTGAFNSILLAPESRKYTTFITPLGQFINNTLTTGQSPSPGAMAGFMRTLLEFKLSKDEKGEVEWESKERQVAKLIREPVPDTDIFYDDVISGTEFKGTYKDSLEYHFKVVAILIGRIAEFGGKISIEKSHFFKAHIRFLGWSISNSYIYPSRKRVQAIIDFPMPTNVRQWRSFCGQISSIRMTCNFSILKNISVLSELCTEKADHLNPSSEQLKAYEEIKKLLIQGPVFSALIDSTAPKIVYSDASSLSQLSKASVGAVLGQIITPKKGIKRVPRYLFLDDPCHVLIQQADLKCCPVRHIKDNELPKDYIKAVGPEFPAEVTYIEQKDFGLENHVENSLLLSLKSLFALHNMNISDENFSKLFKKIHNFIKKDIIGNQLQTFEFNESKSAYSSYKSDILKGKLIIDKNYLIFEVLAFLLSRPIVVISSLDKDRQDPIRTYRSELQRSPFFFLIYKTEQCLVSKIAYLDREMAFDLSLHKGTFEICGYFSKKLPDSMQHIHIQEAELFGILAALESFQKLIGHNELLLVSDSRALYYLMSKITQESSDKLQRWAAKIYAMFPNLKIAFVKSNQNLADLMTRTYNVKASQFKLTGLERMKCCIDDKLMDVLNNKTFTLSEFQEFCDTHPEFLILPESAKQKRIENVSVSPSHFNISELSEELSMNRCIQHFINISDSLKILKDKVSHEKIAEAQHIEFFELYEKIVTSPNLVYSENNIDYSLKNGVIYRKMGTLTSQCMFPKTLLNYLVALFHITTSHGGERRMLASLEPYYAKGLRKRVGEFLRTCLSCILNNYSTSVQNLSYFPVTNSPFYHTHIDMVENLQECNGFTDILICVDAFSLASYAFPMRNRTKNEFLSVFSCGIFQFFKPQILHCDNSKTFINEEALETLAAFGIRTLHTVVNHPASHGLIESINKIYKTAVRKYISDGQTDEWLLLLPLISHQLNSQINPRHGKKPLDLIFGSGRLTEGLDSILNPEVILHPLIKMNEQEVESKKQQWTEYLTEVSDMMNQAKLEYNEKLNKHKTQKNFPEGQIVFLRRVMPSGFESVYHHTLFKVISEKISTLLITRLSDGMTTLVHKNNCKRFDPNLEIFNSLSPEIKSLCIHLSDNETLDRNSYNLILDYDNFEIPPYILSYLGQNPIDILNREFAVPLSSNLDIDDPDNPRPGPSNR